mmetsp:Transcript_32133/g.47268  ORF Transcript_32133/g.47268 Transcript_32133/m.47268 type:complete len:97 (+) Transcript_32133:1562-1852(+)
MVSFNKFSPYCRIYNISMHQIAPSFAYAYKIDIIIDKCGNRISEYYEKTFIRYDIKKVKFVFEMLCHGCGAREERNICVVCALNLLPILQVLAKLQ